MAVINSKDHVLQGQVVDIIQRRIYPGIIKIKNGYIDSIQELSDPVKGPYLLPGFIDAHVHIESSMLIPSEFARLAVTHGTVGTVSDPHEIGNVLGIEGVRFMLQNGSKVPFHFAFGAPSCVPATRFETAGAEISSKEIEILLEKENLKYLSEMMNFPGVLQQDPMVMEKIATAKRLGKPIDGHAPGMRGKDAQAYIAVGITTDHECFGLAEAQEKIKYGIKILIREGSAARNYEALHPLIGTDPSKVMFCSDDKHPNDLLKGHINEIVQRSIEKGYDLMDVLRAAILNPIEHYKLDVGLLRVGDSANVICVEDLKKFKVLETYIKGFLVAKNGQTLIPSVHVEPINRFSTSFKKEEDFAIPAKGTQIRVIEALNGELVTKSTILPAKIENGLAVSDVSRDLLKIAVINRYEDAPLALGFIRNFGLNSGALASCIGHDSHNIIAIGVTDRDLMHAVNGIIEAKGGISLLHNGKLEILPLPIAGIMSHEEGTKIAHRYAELDALAKKLGSPLRAPFMTLSFMALLVIPSLKMSDKGLFDGSTFTFTSLFS